MGQRIKEAHNIVILGKQTSKHSCYEPKWIVNDQIGRNPNFLYATVTQQTKRNFDFSLALPKKLGEYKNGENLYNI